MRDYVLSLRPLMAATGLVLAALAAPAHAFSDDEARKAILDLRQQVQQQNEQSQRAKRHLADQIQALQQEVAQLRDQLELVSRQQPSANKPGGAAGGASLRHARLELMRWMPPPNGITYAIMVSSEPKGGHIDDDTDQNAGDRLGEGQFPSLCNWIGWGGSIKSRSVTDSPGGASGRAAILHCGDGSLRHVTLLGPGGAVPWS